MQLNFNVGIMLCKKLLSHIVIVALLGLIFLTSSNPVTADTRVSSQFSGGAESLAFSGSTIRKRFFFSIYEISHFMAWPEETSGDTDELIELITTGKFAQQLEIVFLRDVSREQVKEALIDGIERNSPSADLREIGNKITKLSESFDSDISENSSLILSRGNNSKLIVYFDDRKIVESDNPELTKALWSIWFGPEPVVDKKALIANQLR